MTKPRTKIVYKSDLPFPFAKAVRAGDFVFVSGQIPFGPDGAIAIQIAKWGIELKDVCSSGKLTWSRRSNNAGCAAYCN